METFKFIQITLAGSKKEKLTLNKSNIVKVYKAKLQNQKTGTEIETNILKQIGKNGTYLYESHLTEESYDALIGRLGTYTKE